MWVLHSLRANKSQRLTSIPTCCFIMLLIYHTVKSCIMIIINAMKIMRTWFSFVCVVLGKGNEKKELKWKIKQKNNFPLYGLWIPVIIFLTFWAFVRKSIFWRRCSSLDIQPFLQRELNLSYCSVNSATKRNVVDRYFTGNPTSTLIPILLTLFHLVG